MKKTKSKIDILLTSYRKKFDKTIQRSELLKRNSLFRSELLSFVNRVGETFFQVKDIDRNQLEKEEENNVLLVLNYPLEDYSEKWKPGSKKKLKTDRYWKELLNFDRATYNPPKNISERVWNKWEILNRYKDRWEEFCERWHIEIEWDGKVESLDRYARQNVEVYQDWDHNTQKHSILISINEWTALEDIKSKWGDIEEYQNRLWGKRERRSNFARDLIWYDLATEHGLKPTEIAKLWDQEYPQDVDLLVLRRFRKEINPNDLESKIWEDENLLKEIQYGQFSAKYKESFNEERIYYVSGKIKKGSKLITTSKPFLDVIKKAILRMKLQISEASMPPLPKDRAYMGLPPQRIS